MITPQRSRITDGITGWSQGQGPAMLLIHGVGMRADYWTNIVPALARNFSLTVIDMPGHGESRAFEETDPELWRYTDSIAEVCAVVSQPVIVVGHSMGALIALDMVVRYSDHVTGIGVFNGVYRRSHESLKAIHARVAELSALKATDPSATLERWFGQTPEGINAQSADACRGWLADANKAGYRDAYRAFANADAPTDEQLQQIKCPALFMTGALEPNSTPAMSQSMSQLVPDSACIVVDEARHMMSMTHGAQIVAALVERFLPPQVPS